MAQKSVTLSDNAAKRILAILAGDPQADVLRVAVDGGGCSGFQYSFNLDHGVNKDDLVVKRDGATVVIDEISLVYMAGSEIDFVDDLIGASFQVNNPNAVASCGCGTSFSI
ncbi:MAG: iron-sulfur cluster insertion protein ErpA [Alphaproteobacteria bacterium]